jgi:hypothetical protein
MRRTESQRLSAREAAEPQGSKEAKPQSQIYFQSTELESARTSLLNPTKIPKTKRTHITFNQFEPLHNLMRTDYEEQRIPDC